jgi:hypothetical protein
MMPEKGMYDICADDGGEHGRSTVYLLTFFAVE